MNFNVNSNVVAGPRTDQFSGKTKNTDHGRQAMWGHKKATLQGIKTPELINGKSITPEETGISLKTRAIEHLAKRTGTFCWRLHTGGSLVHAVARQLPMPAPWLMAMAGFNYLLGSASAACKTGYFQCKNKQCLPDQKVCNGIPGCDDIPGCDWAEDEFPDLCKTRGCSEGAVQCATGECVREADVCDGTEHCLRGEDESPEVCNNPDRTCQPGEFKCDNGKCIPDWKECDTFYDCRNREDEDAERCGHRDCPVHEIACKNQTGQCIHDSWVCDGQIDCIDGSDERDCSSSPSVFTECDEVACLNGYCIDHDDVCDGLKDCHYGEDEDDRHCLVLDHGCVEDLSGCELTKDRIEDLGDRTCLPERWLCDGESDCLGGEDEQGCLTTSPAPTTTRLETTESIRETSSFWESFTDFTTPFSYQSDDLSDADNNSQWSNAAIAGVTIAGLLGTAAVAGCVLRNVWQRCQQGQGLSGRLLPDSFRDIFSMRSENAPDVIGMNSIDKLGNFTAGRKSGDSGDSGDKVALMEHMEVHREEFV